MRRRIAFGTLFVIAASSEFCLAADPRYPDWPCIQAKVPEISLAAVWAGPPLDDVADKWKNDAKVSDLVPKLAARRTPLEDAQKAIAEFLDRFDADKDRGGQAAVRRPVRDTQRPTRVGHERDRAGDPQAARGCGQDPRRHARFACASRRHSARSGQDRRAQQSTGLADADFRGPAARDRHSSAKCLPPIDQRLFALGRVIQQEME